MSFSTPFTIEWNAAAKKAAEALRIRALSTETAQAIDAAVTSLHDEFFQLLSAQLAKQSPQTPPPGNFNNATYKLFGTPPSHITLEALSRAPRPPDSQWQPSAFDTLPSEEQTEFVLRMLHETYDKQQITEQIFRIREHAQRAMVLKGRVKSIQQKHSLPIPKSMEKISPNTWQRLYVKGDPDVREYVTRIAILLLQDGSDEEDGDEQYTPDDEDHDYTEGRNAMREEFGEADSQFLLLKRPTGKELLGPVTFMDLYA